MGSFIFGRELQAMGLDRVGQPAMSMFHSLQKSIARAGVWFDVAVCAPILLRTLRRRATVATVATCFSRTPKYGAKAEKQDAAK